MENKVLKFVSIIGSTGEIGNKTLEIISSQKNKFKVSLLSCNQNIHILKKQVKKFKPNFVYISNIEERDKFKKFKFNFKIKIIPNEKELNKFCESKLTDILVACSSGINSIDPVIYALKSKKKVCIASKEIFLLYGNKIMAISEKYNNKFIPIDSEHSGIFQILENQKIKNVKSIYISASGGPFYGKELGELKNVSIKKALNHPTWKMGQKITIDSATLMNKAIEIIEASIIFRFPSDRIYPIIDKSSQIHSIIEYNDGNFTFSASINDMKVPINYALNYPDRVKTKTYANFNLYNRIELKKINENKHKAFKLCRLALKKGESSMAVLNAANNIAVKSFLNKEISFLQILEIVEKVLKKHKPVKIKKLQEIRKIYKNTEKLTLNICN